MAKSNRTPTIHKKDIIINKDKLKEVLAKRDLDFIEFHKLLVDEYGLDITYKGFMSLLQNRVTWKLIYAHVISESLGIYYTNIFEVVDVDVDKVLKEKEEWNKKYGKDKNNVKKG